MKDARDAVSRITTDVIKDNVAPILNRLEDEVGNEVRSRMEEREAAQTLLPFNSLSPVVSDLVLDEKYV